MRERNTVAAPAAWVSWGPRPEIQNNGRVPACQVRFSEVFAEAVTEVAAQRESWDRMVQAWSQGRR